MRASAIAYGEVSVVDVVDEALGVFADTGPQYEAFGGRVSFANHGPMVVDALVAMGRSDAVASWVERYRPRLDPRPEPRMRIDPSDWRSALGDINRVRDWADFFAGELADDRWTVVANRWLPRLTPGMVGGVHGAIRTGHAVRSIGRKETSERVHELAEALGYWAAQYEELPRDSTAPKNLRPSEAIVVLEQLGLTDRTGWVLFTDPIGKLVDLPSFAFAADLIDTTDQRAVIADLALTFSRILVSNIATVNPRALCHGLTGGVVTDMMLPHLSDESTGASLRYGWQTAAAFYCAIVLHPPAEQVAAPSESVDEIIDEALACPDEHGIKVTELCLRAYEHDPNPVYLAAALDNTRRLNEVGVNLY
jgi:hypothetical protein